VLKQIEGSRAVAEAVAMCRPQLICAYPITSRTHIVEALGALVKKGELNAGFLNVESEFVAMSAVIGASAAGARTYTATASASAVLTFGRPEQFSQRSLRRNGS
jgi:pyruvate ferredoxin oxidoreductase alpha subunit